jgi:hypothetical protein
MFASHQQTNMNIVKKREIEMLMQLNRQIPIKLNGGAGTKTSFCSMDCSNILGTVFEICFSKLFIKVELLFLVMLVGGLVSKSWQCLRASDSAAAVHLRSSDVVRVVVVWCKKRYF